jgi:3-methyladenine DNA glycosylase AlkD
MPARTFDAAKTADEIERKLRRLGTSERAVAEKKYLKSDLEFGGARLAQIRAQPKEVGKDLSRRDVLALVRALWAKPVFERRMAAVCLLELRGDVLEARDLALIERFIRASNTWAFVDDLAGDVAGDLALRFPEARPILDEWARDDDFWVRRSALLALLKPLKKGSDFEQFASYAEPMLEEREFFIRKAIGWVLRETGKVRPQEVYDWLAPRTHRASGVTVREAVKYLSDDRAERLMTAYKEHRPAT